MEYADLSRQQQFEMFQAAKAGKFKQPSDIDDYLASKEPSLLTKALDLRDQAEGKILDTVLPKKQLSDLSPEQTKDLSDAKGSSYPLSKYTPPWLVPNLYAASKADKALSERAGEQPLNLLDNPRFIAHPELAKGLNSLASLANVMSPSGNVLRGLGIPEGAHLGDNYPTAARVVGNIGTRDAVAMAMDMVASAAIPKILRASAGIPPELKGIGAPPPDVPPPLKPFGSPEAQDMADLYLRKDAYAQQQRADQALTNTLTPLKEGGISNAGTTAKVVNSYDLPISQESAQDFAEAFPNHPQTKKLQAAMARAATGEARTKGNLAQPSEDFVVDKGERTPIQTVPTTPPVVGYEHPGATLSPDDARFKTQFQEGMTQTEFPFAPTVGEGAYTTTSPLDYHDLVLGRGGQQNLYTQESDIGKPDQLYHTPETDPAIGGAQKTLPIENNPDFNEILRLAAKHADYAPKDIEPFAMEARNEKMGKVANELRRTLNGINQPLPSNLTPEDLENLLRAGGDGPTGSKIQNVRSDTANRIGFQEDLAPIARGEKALALVKRGQGNNDTRAMFQNLAQNYDLPHLLNESDLHTQGEDFVQRQQDYLKSLYDTNDVNRAAQAKYQAKSVKISAENAALLAKYGAKKFGILPSSQDLYNLSTRSLFSPMGAAVGHLAAEKAGKFAGYGLQKASQFIPEETAQELKSPWQSASLINNLMAPKEEQNGK